MVAVWCFSLGACGGGIQTNSNGVQQADKFAHREDIVYSVLIKINGEVSVMTYRTDGTVWYNVFDANGHQILEASKQIK